ncbi:unnamed protein product [Paramecium primaurelia]|uniref:Uncharacterized protein n=1 Tax=Paramecium primaurelia TaxID=5886 RepID=A0A8S1JQ79_PARPR|nr:unnamed protein product [Paramecium primaurelia]
MIQNKEKFRSIVEEIGCIKNTFFQKGSIRIVLIQIKQIIYNGFKLHFIKKSKCIKVLIYKRIKAIDINFTKIIYIPKNCMALRPILIQHSQTHLNIIQIIHI